MFAPFFPVFCALSPPGRGGSNEPQAGTQGQETAGARAKRGELRPSFDTPGAVGRINWTVRAQDDVGRGPLRVVAMAQASGGGARVGWEGGKEHAGLRRLAELSSSARYSAARL